MTQVSLMNPEKIEKFLIILFWETKSGINEILKTLIKKDPRQICAKLANILNTSESTKKKSCL